MGRTACTEPQCLYKGDLYLFFPAPCFKCIYGPFFIFVLVSMFDRSVRHIKVECRTSRSFLRLDSNAINSPVVLARIRVAGYWVDMVVMVLFGVVTM